MSINPTTPPERLKWHGQERLLRIGEVENLVGLKKTKLYGLITEGRFPAAIHLGTRSVRWKLSDIQSWIDGLQEARP
jgi:Predicted transcriptional regulator